MRRVEIARQAKLAQDLMHFAFFVISDLWVYQGYVDVRPLLERAQVLKENNG